MATLAQQAIGSIVTLRENNVPVNYIVVQQGSPGTAYQGFEGRTVLLRQRLLMRQWHSSNVNDYQNSTIHAWLNGEFFNTFAAEIRNQITQVRIPFRPGSGTSATVSQGANGLLAQVFLLSLVEVGFPQGTWTNMPNAEGSRFTYFPSGTDTAANNQRIGLDAAGTAQHWWLRSPSISSSASAWFVFTFGNGSYSGASVTLGVRPALTLPSSLSVSSDGSIATNTPPSINGADGDLGAQTGPFTQNYIVTDSDAGDVITVTETLNGVQVRQFIATSGAQQTFTITPELFLQAPNGTSTLVVTAVDLAGASAVRTWTFSRSENRIDIQLQTPFPADAQPARVLVNVTRQIPPGATFQVLVCNNANDPSPTWEDATAMVNAGLVYQFTNTTSTSGTWGVNIRVIVERNSAVGPCWIMFIGGNFD